MRLVIRNPLCAAILSAALAACGGSEESKQAERTAPPEQAAAEAPVPSDFNPCSTTTFEQVRAVIGTQTTISSRDITGAASPGWAMCAYGRADRSAGPTFAARIARFESSTAAARRHADIVGGLANAQSIPGDPNNAAVWSDGANLHVQYQSGWWIVRRTVEGQTDADARARLLATPRWPRQG